MQCIYIFTPQEAEIAGLPDRVVQWSTPQVVFYDAP